MVVRTDGGYSHHQWQDRCSELPASHREEPEQLGHVRFEHQREGEKCLRG